MSRGLWVFCMWAKTQQISKFRRSVIKTLKEKRNERF